MEMSGSHELGFETRAIHGDDPHHFPGYGDIVPPISLSTTFFIPQPGVKGPHIYTRWKNPTRDILEQTLASLEQGKYGE
jgi:cystathionine beta-lyase/cystathionine gamma-synthase